MLLPMFIDIMNGVRNKDPLRKFPGRVCAILIIISIILLIL